MLTKNQLGFLYMFLSVIAFSLMDLIVKWSDNYPLGQVLVFRSFFGFIPILFLIPKKRFKNFYYTKRPGLHFLRSFAGIIALVAIFIALRKLPLAVVVSLSYASPIFITIFSIFFLSEKVGPFRWLAVIIGFIGVLIISEPGFTNLNIFYLLPIIFCIGLAFVSIILRKMSTTEPVWLMTFYFTLTIGIVGLGTLPFGWIMPTPKDFFALAMIGILGGFANLWLTQAYKLAEVSLVSPLRYLSIIFALSCGYLIWNEIPTSKTLVGAFFVISASLIIFIREFRNKKEISVIRHE
tara:strand:- start:625 stop:1506 length:882 start_codon:yes stop_codon:yes gene_type:complete